MLALLLAEQPRKSCTDVSMKAMSHWAFALKLSMLAY